MTKVLVICEFSTLNGGERSFLSVLPLLRDVGFDISVAAPTSGDFARELSRYGVRHCAFELHHTDRTRLDIGTARNKLGDLITEIRPDIVHANSLSMSRLVGPVACKRGISSIAHLRDIINMSRAVIQDLNTNMRILAVSHATRDWHASAGIDQRKMFVVYNGVDLEHFAPRQPTGLLHNSLGIDHNMRLIGSIGQIGMRKGLDTLFKAAQTFISETDDVHLLIVGQRHSEKQESIEFEANLHQLASSIALNGRVHFLGWQADIARLMNELSLLVHAARQEPFGRVLLEAAASGVPVVATDVGGTCEIFPSNCPAAKLVPVDDANALASAVAEVLSDSKLHTKMSNASRLRATEAFDVRFSATRIAEHYRDVCSSFKIGWGYKL